MITKTAFDKVDEAHVSEGQSNTVYFQIINESKHIRYMTQASSYSVFAIFPNINSAEELEIAAIQPFIDDKSIWKVELSADQIPSSGSFIVKMIEDGVERKFKAVQSIVVELLSDGGC